MENAQNILTKLGLKWDEVDTRIVRVCCDTISSRSARLCAAALAAITNRIRTNRKLGHLKTTVGVDGTVYKKLPKWVDEGGKKRHRRGSHMFTRCDEDSY